MSGSDRPSASRESGRDETGERGRRGEEECVGEGLCPAVLALCPGLRC